MLKPLLSVLTCTSLLWSITGQAVSLSGSIAGELRYYPDQGLYTDQDYQTGLSLSAQPEFYWASESGNDSLLFTPFIRLDQWDAERSHADIRDLSWIHVGDDWELRTGIRRVFWGVTEFQHLVDVINQTDAVEDLDGEDKLGQPMLNLSLVNDWGIVDLFLLTGFRERTFAGSEGRLRPALPVIEKRAEYESAAEEKHLDTALRWSNSYDLVDLGLYWFHGTQRDPELQLTLEEGVPVLTPYYPQMDQFGLDLQATLDSWLWKLELLYRDSRADDFWALQGGFEYTLYGIADSAADLGLLMEYGWDQRGTRASSTFQRDLFVGARLALNDAASSELLFGVGHDLDYQSQSVVFEASRRLGGYWRISLDGRFFSADEPVDPLYQLRRDDHLQLTLERYF
ncbi:hypothetical protein [Neptuniibacter sp. CAU 1671]|uniref:hypothetical protein n=1 Tax=Neptuniibacter sp. CAU 1671 TaxID=3032593 RepID=UPI0023DB2F16|nr:hypothetical protein [Neptuniibacter sp. CAU 1671]MDF2181013.1 hypothetical protein [Neptuniibacter sp. CAU 1671]